MQFCLFKFSWLGISADEFKFAVVLDLTKFDFGFELFKLIELKGFDDLFDAIGLTFDCLLAEFENFSDDFSFSGVDDSVFEKKNFF